MRTLRHTFTVGGMALAGLLIRTPPAAAQGTGWTLTTVYSFGVGSNSGVEPYAGVVIGDGGVLYGTTRDGGLDGHGEAFSLTPPTSAGAPWSENVLYSFRGGGSSTSDGSYPAAALAIGRGGVLYGTTYGGGGKGVGKMGTVFSLKPPAFPGGSWTEKVLYAFPRGYGPPPSPAGVVIGSGTVLYGTTSSGGASGYGTVFSLTPPASPSQSWTETVLYNFMGGPADGRNPLGGVVIGSGGVLYGTTERGGVSNDGTIFSLTPPASAGGAWSETVLYNFFSSGGESDPEAGVVIGSGGVLYGTTEKSAPGYGAVFSLTPPGSPGGSWTEAVLYKFAGGNDVEYPVAALTLGSGGVLYGTGGGGSLGQGTVFSLTPPASPGGSWSEAVIYTFSGGSDGSAPTGLVIGSGGVLYGATTQGGTFNAACPSGCGTVFSLTQSSRSLKTGLAHPPAP